MILYDIATYITKSPQMSEDTKKLAYKLQLVLIKVLSRSNSEH